jgi:hypothetical protein
MNPTRERNFGNKGLTVDPRFHVSGTWPGVWNKNFVQQERDNLWVYRGL